MWVVIIISSALLFNGNGWFIFFVQPLHPLVCFTLSFASPFHAANNAYNHTCLGSHREKQTKPGKQKTTPAKPKETQKNTFERMWFWLKRLFFLVVLSFVWFLVLKWKKNMDFVVFFWMDISKKTKQLIVFGFPTFYVWFSALNSLIKQKQHWIFVFFDILIDHIHSFFPSQNQITPKKTRENNLSKTCFLFFGFAGVFFLGLSIDSHDCHLCRYACLPYRSWEVKFWSKFLT